ncbi:MAG: hypothetical protein ABI880_01260 [Acidobacteriota bacterium]
MTDPSPHLTHDDLVLHYYGEAADSAVRVATHLRTCAACRHDSERLQRTLALIEANAEGEPPTGYEATMWARLKGQLDAPRPWWRRLVNDGPVRWAMAGTLAAVLVGAFMAGWLAREVAAPPPARVEATDTDTAAAVGKRVLVAAVGQHLERTQMMLAEVLNASHGAAMDVAVDRARAADLVATNRLFQQSAELAGDAQIDDVLEELERVLVELANAPADLAPADLDALRARLERGGLIFRVRVLSDQLRARQEPGPLDQTKGSTS